MRIYLFFILAFIVENLFAQKPVIDSVAYAQWPSFGFLQLSNDGKYVIYNVENKSTGKNIVFLQSTNGKWKKEIVDGSFTANSKFFCYKQGKDSLAMLMPGTDEIKYFADISSFGLQTTKEGECLYYSPVSQPRALVLMDVKTYRKRIFEDVLNWKFSEDGTVLLLGKPIKDNADQQSLNWVDMATGKTTKIVEGKKAEIILLDGKHQQCIYKQENTFWYYKINTKPVSLNDRINAVIKDGFSLENTNNFSKDGKHLFLSLKGIENPKPVVDAVEVWSYSDEKLQTEQNEDINSESYLAVFDLSNHKLIQLQQSNTDYFFFPQADGGPDTLALVQRWIGLSEPWSRASVVENFLISIRTGEKKDLSFLNGNRLVSWSAYGKFIVYYSVKDRGYFSYEITTGIIRSLTKDIAVSWKRLYCDDRGKNADDVFPRGVYEMVWQENDENVLVYDTYDIWKLDPLSNRQPVNLTGGYGKKHHVVFSFMFNEPSRVVLKKDERLYLNAFNMDNKDNGFYLKQLNQTGEPELLTMGPYIFCSNSGYVPQGSDFNPIKAKTANTYIVRRMSASEYPNYYSTKDFRKFTEISRIHPEKKYNWFNTELHNWKSLDGRDLKGILYKPENFDHNKKYPVIFHYYERKSDALNAFLNPYFSQDNIDIPTYVSNGYLVFCPDIYYTVGNPMQGTYDAVVSAADYISNLSFVNPDKMGLQGHSFGGVQTNYLVTHTNLFAAAVSASGVADLISNYGAFRGNQSLQHFHETGQPRMGGSLWEIPEQYINNSSIFQVDKVATPILMMHTKNDGTCAYSNALEFFTGLRRMGKRAWMLVYPDEDHGLSIKKNYVDYTQRMMQFFDHYLKDKPVPIWMTKGIPASRRGLDNGYEYDPKTSTPGPGLLSEAEQMKVDSLMTRKPMTISLR